MTVPKIGPPFLRIVVKNIESQQNINLTMKYTICKAINIISLQSVSKSGFQILFTNLVVS